MLTKTPDGTGVLPQASAGISLFIVPKVLVDGTLNDIAVAGLNHKMAYAKHPIPKLSRDRLVLNIPDMRYDDFEQDAY